MTLSAHAVVNPVTADLAEPNALLEIGSEDHKQSFCAMLTESVIAYKPASIAWPGLSPDARQRLAELPFWNEALFTEGYASARMQAMADTVEDPRIRQAIGREAFEDDRHKQVLLHMLDAYAIPHKNEPALYQSNDAEWRYLCASYGGSFDSFFIFGLYRLARESGYFPPELFAVFEPLVQEKARHVLFFSNWVEWSAAQKSGWQRSWFRAKCIAAFALMALGRVSLASAVDGGKGNDNFVATGGKGLLPGFTTRKLIEAGLEETVKRMARYDLRLTRPRVMPFFARLMLKVL